MTKKCEIVKLHNLELFETAVSLTKPEVSDKRSKLLKRKVKAKKILVKNEYQRMWKKVEEIMKYFQPLLNKF